jgi:hypothetical protein
MNNPWKISKPWLMSIAGACCIIFYVFSYHLERSNFNLLLTLYSGLFVGYYFLISSDYKYKFVLGLIFRMVLVLQIPNLSQDFYRFIWDGRLLNSSINPYSFLPIDIVEKVFDGQFLLEKMGNLSGHNHSNYPPLNQLIFAIGAFLSPKNVLGNVLVLRTIIILADIGIYIFGRKILEFLNLEKEKIHYYFLNPLVIIELTGNLHFEGVMMSFLCIGFYFFYKNKYSFSAVFIALAILTKLIPLLLLPFFIKKIAMKKLIAFYAIIGILWIAAFLPFFDSNLFENYTKTVGLWFTNFEFNGSIYYLLREIGYWITGYNMIAIIGKITPVFIVFYIGYLAFTKSNFLENQYLALMVYFFLSTTIHPWYLISMIFLGVFLNTKSIWFWSFTVIFSYAAYGVNHFQEKPIFLIFEYLPVFTLFYLEHRSRKINYS